MIIVLICKIIKTMAQLQTSGMALNWQSSQLRISKSGLVFVIALHGAILGALLSMEVVKVPDTMTTLMVQMLPSAPPTPEIVPPRPKTPTPQIKPQPQAKPLPTPPVIAAQTAAPAAAEAPRAPEKPTPVASAPAPAQLAVSEPRFDADYLDNPAPVYPPVSRRTGEEGKVILRVFVEPDGRPSQILIRSGSGSDRLDKAAEAAVWRWKFVSARRGSEAVGAWVLVPIVFSLRG